MTREKTLQGLVVRVSAAWKVSATEAEARVESAPGVGEQERGQERGRVLSGS